MEKTTARVRRNIIKIDEDKCDGCGICVTACAEGALKIIDGKARLVSEKYCDSLGACLPGCPQGAISIEEREAEPFDEKAVKAYQSKQMPADQPACGCPSSSISQFKATTKMKETPEHVSEESELAHWPVQLTLVPPGAPFLKGADVLLAADCTAFACGSFHSEFLRGHALLIACPKLDNYEAHLAKLTAILQQSDIKSLTVLRMDVPCCSALTRMAMRSIISSNKDIPFKEVIIGTRGDIKT